MKIHNSVNKTPKYCDFCEKYCYYVEEFLLLFPGILLEPLKSARL